MRKEFIAPNILANQRDHNFIRVLSVVTIRKLSFPKKSIDFVHFSLFGHKIDVFHLFRISFSLSRGIKDLRRTLSFYRLARASHHHQYHSKFYHHCRLGDPKQTQKIASKRICQGNKHTNLQIQIQPK